MDPGLLLWTVKSQHPVKASGKLLYTITGGSIAVVALGSTGCSMVCSSSASAEIIELDLSLLAVVFCVSALCKVLAKREDMLPLFLAEDCRKVLVALRLMVN